LSNCARPRRFPVVQPRYSRAGNSSRPAPKAIVLKHSANHRPGRTGGELRRPARYRRPRPARVQIGWRHPYPTSNWLRSIWCQTDQPHHLGRAVLRAIHRPDILVLAGDMARATNASVAPGGRGMRNRACVHRQRVCQPVQSRSRPLVGQTQADAGLKPFGCNYRGSLMGSIFIRRFPPPSCLDCQAWHKTGNLPSFNTPVTHPPPLKMASGPTGAGQAPVLGIHPHGGYVTQWHEFAERPATRVADTGNAKRDRLLRRSLMCVT